MSHHSTTTALLLAAGLLASCGGGTSAPAPAGCTPASDCVVRTCQGMVYACGDCQDNDGDCKIDSADPECLGPCDNTEDSYHPGIVAVGPACRVDCYFDGDGGSGNDDCYWSHTCDPLEVSPSFPPEGNQCAYNPTTTIVSGVTCSQASSSQSTQCMSYCAPLTPNGCDCFGCCAIPGAPTAVWLGTENPEGTGSCTKDTLADPTKCAPCTPVASCLNTCESCELCVGKTTLPPGCLAPTCPAGVQPCGLSGQAACASGSSCITGCCIPNPP